MSVLEVYDRGIVFLSAAPVLNVVLEIFAIMQNAAQKICSIEEANEADNPVSTPFWGIRNAQYTRASKNIL